MGRRKKERIEKEVHPCCRTCHRYSRSSAVRAMGYCMKFRKNVRSAFICPHWEKDGRYAGDSTYTTW